MVGGLYRSAKNDDEEGKGGEDRGEDGEGDDPGPGGSRPRRKVHNIYIYIYMYIYYIVEHESGREHLREGPVQTVSQ